MTGKARQLGTHNYVVNVLNHVDRVASLEATGPALTR
jgi:hypothetical protein